MRYLYYFSIYFLIIKIDGSIISEVIQTTILGANFALQFNPDRIAQEANDLTREQIKQDMQIAWEKIKQEQKLFNENAELVKGLNEDLVDTLFDISFNIRDVTDAIRTDMKINRLIISLKIFHSCKGIQKFKKKLANQL